MADRIEFPAIESKREGGSGLLIGLIGPSFSGKTKSALRLATGMQSIIGGAIHVVDTENKRSSHYSGEFKFKRADLGPPFSSERYEKAIRDQAAQGAKTIIVDSMSHEHEGEGGALDFHDAEVERMGGDRHNFRAWAKPKAARTRLKNTMLQLNVNLILCFRAKEKSEAPKGNNPPKELGWMAIGADDFVYEMAMQLLLPPGAMGVPLLKPSEPGSARQAKVPDYLEGIFRNGETLSEKHGEALARWSMGEEVGASRRVPSSPPIAATTHSAGGSMAQSAGVVFPGDEPAPAKALAKKFIIDFPDQEPVGTDDPDRWAATIERVLSDPAADRDWFEAFWSLNEPFIKSLHNLYDGTFAPYAARVTQAWTAKAIGANGRAGSEP